MAIDKALVEARKRRIAGEASDTPAIIAKLYSKKYFARVGHNVNLLARSLLLRGMMSYRVDGNVDGAIADFRAASELTKEFDRALEGIEKSDPQNPSSDVIVAPF